MDVLPRGLVSSIFFGRRFADLQEPFAAASIARAGQSNERKQELIPALLALPSPIAIHLPISSGPILTSPCPRRGRRKPLEKRCRRERCNARQLTQADSFNRNARHRVRRLTAAQRALMLFRALHPTRRTPSARADLPSDKGRFRE